MSTMSRILALAALLVALGGMQGCKKAETVSAADVLGTWEIKSWSQGYSNSLFKGCDMKGTLEFIAHSYDGRPYYRVRFTFKRDGLPQIMEGDADLAGLPVITFECWFGGGFPDNMGFRGIVEQGRMLGYGGFYWDIRQYGGWEWEAVKK